MGLFTPYHGNYEITYKASTHPVMSWENEKEKTMVVEADDRRDARRVAEKILKKQGFEFCTIISEHLIKRTSETKNSNNNSSSGTNSEGRKNKSGALASIILVPLIVIFFIVALISVRCSSKELNGKYELIDTYGTANIQVDDHATYMELNNGDCVLHLTLIDPAGNSTHYFTYTGDDVDNIEFNKEYIHMDSSGRIILRLTYENQTYTVMVFRKG